MLSPVEHLPVIDTVANVQSELIYRCGGSVGFIYKSDAPTSRFITFATPETADRIRISKLYCQFGNHLLPLSGLTISQGGFKMRASSGALISIRVKREVGEKPTLPPQR